MDFAALKKDYDRDGFVVVRQFLVEDDLAVLTRQLDRYISEVVPTLPDGDAFYHDKSRPETLKQMQHMGQDAFFRDYRQHKSWCELATTLIGEPAQAQEPEWFNKPPGIEHLTPPHQDNYYFNLLPPNAATLWLALDDVDAENGCLRYVRGSHRRGLRPHAATSVLGFSQGITDYGPGDTESEVAVKLRPGDLVAHHCETIHRADVNRSATRNRRAFAFVFRGESCQLNEEAHQRYLAHARRQHESMGLQSKLIQGYPVDDQ